MNQGRWVTAGSLACFAIVWTGGILVGSRTVADETAGTVTMRLNCSRARGSWSAEPGGSAASGRFEFGPLAATSALKSP